jgi:hypothetical protein
MVFDTKVAILVLEHLPVWQKLNVAAFLATGSPGRRPRRSASLMKTPPDVSMPA